MPLFFAFLAQASCLHRVCIILPALITQDQACLRRRLFGSIARWESAVLTKVIPLTPVMTFRTRDGRFLFMESQYGNEGESLITRVLMAFLGRKRVAGQYVWTYQDRAPGSTDASGQL